MAHIPKLRTLLFRLSSFALGLGLLYLALRGVDLREIWLALKRANYWWLPPLAALTLLSHVIRAWRWRLLLDALPDPDRAGCRRPTVAQAFQALMIGYMVNYAAPRLGELARAASLSRTSRLHFSSVLGTVAAERLLDLLTLGLALLSVLGLLLHQWEILHQLFILPLLHSRSLGFLVLGGALLLLLTGWGIYLGRRSRLLRHINRRLRAPLQAFQQGLLTVRRMHRPGTLVISTLIMWACYWGMASLPLVMLHLTEAYRLGPIDVWVLMVLGAVGAVLPSPGGLGSYHYVTVQVMVHLLAVPQKPAATYAVLTHAAQMVLYTLTGFVCLLLQGRPGDPSSDSGLEALPGRFLPTSYPSEQPISSASFPLASRN